MGWFYRYESKGIQSWILDSNLMRDLAGGSALVESLTTIAAERATRLGARVLQSTSGSMTALFQDRETLEKFASTWPMTVALVAPGLQIVQAWMNQQEQGAFKRLFVRLAERRNVVDVMDIEAGPWVLRAGRSGLPALPHPADLKGRRARMTAVDVTAVAKERSRERFRKACGPVTGGRPWSDFDEESDRWDGPAGVIHADGSGVGERLMAIGSDSAEKLSEFSSALRDATTEATRQAIGVLPMEGERILARPIVSAGDDLTCIVPARCARRFAEEWIRVFEAETGRRPILGRMVAGAGVAIVHSGFPFARANEIAEALCKAAKNAVEKKCGVVAFRRVTTSLIEEETRGSIAWRVEGESQGGRLDTLIEAVSTLPRGTLRNWLSLFERQDATARQYWRRAAEVAEESCWRQFILALREAGADSQTGELLEAGVAVALKESDRVTPVKDALMLARIEKVVRRN